jgi:hypothetical protein
MATVETTEQESGLIDLESRMEKFRGVLATEPSAMKRAILLAKAVQLATRYVRQHVRDLAALQGSPLGFATDKEYTPDELVQPLTEAAIRGLPFVGNCVNVIAKRLYIPLEGYEHLFRSDARFTWPLVRLGSVEIVDESRWVDLPKERHYEANGRRVTGRTVPGQARVEIEAECTFEGRPVRISCRDNRATGGLDERVVIRVNSGMGEDAILGKAKRRAYKRLWGEAIGGRGLGVDADDDDGTLDAAATPAAAPVAVVDASTTPLSAGEIPPMDAYAADLEDAQTVADAGRVYDKWFGPDRSNDWTPEQNQRGVALWKARNEQIRTAAT